jgi:outer membrane protein assembly factor BamB
MKEGRMRPMVTAITQVAVVVLLSCASLAQAQISQILVDDSPTPFVEANVLNLRNVAVRLAGGPPTTADVTVDYTLVSGSAVAGSDFVALSGTLTFKRLLDSSLTVVVQIIGDTIDEWNPTLQQDEVFFLQLSNPSANATILKGRGTITLMDDDHSQAGVQYLSAVTDSTAAGSPSTDGRNRLQWRIPPAPAPQTQIKVCWKSASSNCTPPVSDTDTDPGGCSVIDGPFTPGARHLFTHDNTSAIKVQVPRAYCYSVWTMYPAFTNERAEVSVTTFDSLPGPLKWTLTPGHYRLVSAAALVPPTVGAEGIYSVGTDGIVQAMQRGASATSGLWPPAWNPVALGKPAHNRSPVVPFPSPLGSRYFVGTENGEVHAVDAKTGTLVWSRAAGYPPGSRELLPGATGVQATPALLVKSFGGFNDLVLVGTATAVGDITYFALDPATGATLDSYGPPDPPPGPIDNVFGMSVVDYADNRVYFGTAGRARTLWGLDLGPSGAPDLKLSPLAWNPKPLGVGPGTAGSLVARNGHLYVGVDSGAAATLYSLRIADGFLASYNHMDDQLKGFAWPDRRDDRLYFSTTNRVHGVRDTGAPTMSALWSPISVQDPSIPLQMPGTDHLWVGDGQGRLHQIDVSAGNIKATLTLDADQAQIGAPSLDGPNGILIVGSDSGVIYAVRVPF